MRNIEINRASAQKDLGLKSPEGVKGT
jgi:hypothetical protein